MKRLKVIACDVLNREISWLCSQSQCYTDVTFLHQGLHDTPEILRDMLQKEIDQAEEGFPYNHDGSMRHYDAIILAYGLCSNGTAGLTCANVPLVIPRAHDCITLLLGSKERYLQEFEENPGTYWFSAGWLERAWQPSRQKYAALMKTYTEKYGEDNAQYLLELEQHWMKDYRRASLILWDGLPNSDRYRQDTLDAAAYLGWDFTEYSGDCSLLSEMLRGEFNEDRVQIIYPGQLSAPSFNTQILTNKRTP